MNNSSLKSSHIFLGLFCLMVTIVSCEEAVDNPFWDGGNEIFESQRLFDRGRLPNVVVTTKGTILATWGRYDYRVRQSEDGGMTWGRRP